MSHVTGEGAINVCEIGADVFDGGGNAPSGESEVPNGGGEADPLDDPLKDPLGSGGEAFLEEGDDALGIGDDVLSVEDADSAAVIEFLLSKRTMHKASLMRSLMFSTCPTAAVACCSKSCCLGVAVTCCSKSCCSEAAMEVAATWSWRRAWASDTRLAKYECQGSA